MKRNWWPFTLAASACIMGWIVTAQLWIAGEDIAYFVTMAVAYCSMTSLVLIPERKPKRDLIQYGDERIYMD